MQLSQQKVEFLSTSEAKESLKLIRSMKLLSTLHCALLYQFMVWLVVYQTYTVLQKSSKKQWSTLEDLYSLWEIFFLTQEFTEKNLTWTSQTGNMPSMDRTTLLSKRSKPSTIHSACSVSGTVSVVQDPKQAPNLKSFEQVRKDIALNSSTCPVRSNFWNLDLKIDYVYKTDL